MLLDKQNMMFNSVPFTAFNAAAAFPSDPLGSGPPTVVAPASIGAIDLGLAAFLPRRTTGLTVLAMVSGGTVGGASTITIAIHNVATPATAPAAGNLVATSGALPVANFVSGYEIPIEIPDSIKLTARYLIAVVTPATAAATAATGTPILDVGLVPDGDRQTSQV